MPWLVRLAGAKLAPWILLGGVLALGISHAVVYVKGRANGASQERVAQAKATEKARAKIQTDHEAELKSRGWQDTAEAEYARAARRSLESRIADLATIEPRTLIKTVTVTNEQGCNCPVPTLGDDFWLRFRAAGRRPEADPATADTVPSRVR